MRNLLGISGTILLLFLILSCNKDEDNIIKDGDGNVYISVAIGAQTWLVENLKTTKYNNGTVIPNVTDITAWQVLGTGAYCWFNNEITNKSTYGALYNWYAVNHGNLCPIGWHVPTDAEWSTLTTFLGGEMIAGGKLKETGTSHWLYPNIDATNSTSFTALPGSGRGSVGTFFQLGLSGDWWSSTERATEAWGYELIGNNGYVYRNPFPKGNGFSVRCIKD